LRLNVDDNLHQIRELAVEKVFDACGQIMRLSNTEIG
jgi:hypothetical protein